MRVAAAAVSALYSALMLTQWEPCDGGRASTAVQSTYQAERAQKNGSARKRALQVSSSGDITETGDTVVDGVLEMLTTDALDACLSSCKAGLAAAFNITEAGVGCLCPDASASRRRLVRIEEEQDADLDSKRIGRGENSHPQADFPGTSLFLLSQQLGSDRDRRRYLRGLAELDSRGRAAFAVRIPGGLSAAAEALDSVTQTGLGAVASAFGVQESEVELSTLTVTPPSSPGGNQTLSVIAQYADAADIDLVPNLNGSGADYAGGGRGVALFLSLLVLLVGTACCCMAGFAIARKKKGKPSSRKRASLSKSFTPSVEQQPRRSGSHSDSASPAADSFPLVAGKQSSSDFSMAQINSSGIHGRAIASAPPYEAGGGSSTASGVAPGSISGAGMSLASSPLPSPSRDIAGTGKVSRIGSRETDLSSMGGVGRARGGGASVGGTGAGSGSTASGGAGVVAAAMADDGAMRQTSPRDTRETNPLYKSVAPLSRTPRVSGETKQQETPGRSRIGEFLSNVTPNRLRNFHNRRPSRSPALSRGSKGSHGSRRSKRSTGSKGSSSTKKSHRRDGSFPGVYTQRNSSEMDHQRPPADPVYTFMIKTIAAKGFKFMTTTEIAFCAMRMYSHFRRTEGNYKRLAVMKNAENVPPVYEIIWLCGANSEQPDHRFFSTSRGTDAEQQKSLLACLLALSWNGSGSSRRTLRRALSPMQRTKVPSSEDIFWNEFKDSTDALSGDDQMVVLARVVLLLSSSSNRPMSDASSESSSRTGAGSPSMSGAAHDEESGIVHGDIVKALSGAHLREVGISLKAARPGWQEAHVQLVSVLLVIAFLEEGTRTAGPGDERPDPLSSLEWVGVLTPDALDAFLVEKLEARRALVELDLEPSGLVIKHDEEGELERVEPAMVEKGRSGSWTGSRGHQQILPRSASGKGDPSRGKRGHRRSRSVETPSTSGSSKSKGSHSPVKITTVSRKHSGGDGRGDGSGSIGGFFNKDGSSTGNRSRPSSTADSTRSGFSVDDTGTGLSGKKGLRTIAQQKMTPPTKSEKPSPAREVADPAFSSTPDDAASSTVGGMGGGGPDGFSVPPLTINTEVFSVPSKGRRGRNEITREMSPGGVSDAPRSENSSVVTRVYAPSMAGTADDQAGGFGAGRSAGGTSWVPDASWQGSAPSSPVNEGGMSQVSIAASRFLSSPMAALNKFKRDRGRSSSTGISAGTDAGSSFTPTANHQGGRGAAPGARQFAATLGRSQDLSGIDSVGFPSGMSDAERSEAGYSEAASRYDASFDRGAGRRGRSVSSGVGPPPTLVIDAESRSPTSAAGSRFEDSPSSDATSMSRVAGSPTAASGRGGTGPLYTGRSAASSMRSGNSSFFKIGSARSLKSSESRGRSSASASSWDEDDLQNMGTRWLSERAYNQKFEDKFDDE